MYLKIGHRGCQLKFFGDISLSISIGGDDCGLPRSCDLMRKGMTGTRDEAEHMFARKSVDLTPL